MSWATKPNEPALHKLTAAELAEILSLLEAVANCNSINGALGTTDSVTGTAYADLVAGTPGSSISFRKVRSDTDLEVEMAMGWFTATAGTGVRFGARVNGVDYDIAQSAQTSSTSVALHAMGTRKITGLAAGTYTIQGRWKQTVASGTCNRNADSWVTMAARERLPA